MLLAKRLLQHQEERPRRSGKCRFHRSRPAAISLAHLGSFSCTGGFAQGAVQLDIQLDHVARVVPAEDLEMLRFAPRFAKDSEAVRVGCFKSGPPVNVARFIRRVVGLPGLFDEDRPPAVSRDAVNLQLRRLQSSMEGVLNWPAPIWADYKLQSACQLRSDFIRLGCWLSVRQGRVEPVAAPPRRNTSTNSPSAFSSISETAT
jgi:hypothetical protein